MQNFRFTFNVDFVFCIDTTHSMRHAIDFVKRDVLNLYSGITAAMNANRRVINKLRVRIIAFRDYLYDENMAMQTSSFFDLPEQAEQLEEFVSLLQADGGGDSHKSGLEALAYAIRSDWERDGIRKRQIIVLYTDAAAHTLGTGSDSEYYSKELPETFEVLASWWADGQNKSPYIDRLAKRLLLYAPGVEPWLTIASTWDNVIHVQTTLNANYSELDIKTVYSFIFSSI